MYEEISENALDYAHELVNAQYAGTRRDYVNDLWSSDWNGEDVGYPEIDIVGLYTLKDKPVHYYVNTETGVVLEAWLAMYV